MICAEALKYADKSGRLEAKVDRLADELRKITELRERHHYNLHDAVTIAEEALRDHEQDRARNGPRLSGNGAVWRRWNPTSSGTAPHPACSCWCTGLLPW